MPRMHSVRRSMLLLTWMVLAMMNPRAASAATPERQCYQILVYHYAAPDQERMIDHYLETALVPSLHRSGNRTVGVFAPVANDTAADKRIYVLFTLKGPGQVWEFPGLLGHDSGIRTGHTARDGFASTPYWQSDHAHPPYSRLESILVKAWRMAPTMRLPQLTAPKADRIYELRSYESANERYYWNKIHMFQEGGELALFTRDNFNAIFYGDVVSGPRMPNLMYMTSFENMADRDARWKLCDDDPDWIRLFERPEYQHNVSNADIIVMRAKPYSDF